MATRAVTVAMRDAAERRIADASAALAERFGLDPAPPRPYEGRDPAFAAARDLERVGDLLEAIVAATDPDADADEPDQTPDADGIVPSGDLDRMTRAALDALAGEAGIADPGAYRTKADLIAALRHRAEGD